MERLLVLHHVLSHIVSSQPARAIEHCALALADARDPYVSALQSVAQFMNRDYESAAVTSATALADAHDPQSRMLALAARGLAHAGWMPEHSGTSDASGGDCLDDPLAVALRELHTVDASPEPLRTFTFYLLTEAALACARLDLAATFLARWGELPTNFLVVGGLQHPYVAMMHATRIRLLAFSGKISEASALSQRHFSVEQTSVTRLVLDSTACLVRGNAADRSAVRALAERLEKTKPEPRDYITSGCYLLVAYGLLAAGDTARAARSVLVAGSGVELEKLSIIDRALGLEMLTAAAIADNDLTGASAWCALALPLLRSPIAAPTVERLVSRVELFAGNAHLAAEWATFSLAHLETGGRVIERAETELILSQAHLALSQRTQASAHLEAVAQDAALTGHLAARRAAMRALRLMGRRLRPAPGSGLSGLSERETDVALLVSEGYTNAAIARELHLSEHTVHVHVSRALYAFGVASRFALASQLAAILPSDSQGTEPRTRGFDRSGVQPSGTGPVLAELTPRQNAVVEQIVKGHSNQLIAQELELSIKTVEKHVTEVFIRWGVDSRIAVARIARDRHRDNHSDTAMPGTEGGARSAGGYSDAR
ncbi:MAG: response regulator transcription factor [Microbacteriaceae bacterium]